ncbi:hypothetical protein [Dyadobacter chenwenxiniae]|nr:hypothetical protein [Dyadobacter chenwenxiniae]
MDKETKLKLMADALQVTQKQLRKMIDRGEILLEDVEGKLTERGL